MRCDGPSMTNLPVTASLNPRLPGSLYADTLGLPRDGP